MSRRDTYHNIVKQALIREGWTITHEQYNFDTDPQLSTDLGAEKRVAAERKQEKIAVEIKSFLAESQVSELEKAVGQYGLYRRFLKIQDQERKLYLAVPFHAFENIFKREVGQIAIEEFDLKLIVFSTSSEEPLLWHLK
ncbi:MAG: element excision factor XisH family protein [Candidatus Parabeggiatoa sp.]|nr:element excision factor XisH family protein [Candidatus Parabeggiatoa sp.]